MHDSHEFNALPPFRVITELETAPETNMKRDEALARQLQPRDAVVRLYSWEPHAISLGYSQPADHIDTAKAAKDGLTIVRRPTGGRAVLHSDELTYAAIFRTDASISVGRLHDQIVKMILDGLRQLGHEAPNMALTDNDAPSTRAAYTSESSTRAVCFASTSRHEAVFQGRKFIGSAQRRFGDVVLQHGSILLSDHHTCIADYLVGDDQYKAAARALLRTQTISLSEIYGRVVSKAEAASALREHISRSTEARHTHIEELATQ